MHHLGPPRVRQKQGQGAGGAQGVQGDQPAGHAAARSRRRSRHLFLFAPHRPGAVPGDAHRRGDVRGQAGAAPGDAVPVTRPPDAACRERDPVSQVRDTAGRITEHGL